MIIRSCGIKSYHSANEYPFEIIKSHDSELHMRIFWPITNKIYLKEFAHRLKAKFRIEIENLNFPIFSLITGDDKKQNATKNIKEKHI